MILFLLQLLVTSTVQDQIGETAAAVPAPPIRTGYFLFHDDDRFADCEQFAPQKPPVSLRNETMDGQLRFFISGRNVVASDGELDNSPGSLLNLTRVRWLAVVCREVGDWRGGGGGWWCGGCRCFAVGGWI